MQKKIEIYLLQAIMVEKIANSSKSTCKGNKGIVNSVIILYEHVQDRETM